MLVSAKITRHNHSIVACSRHISLGAIFRVHPVRGESHIQRNDGLILIRLTTQKTLQICSRWEQLFSAKKSLLDINFYTQKLTDK